jgi:hypothetical protein
VIILVPLIAGLVTHYFIGPKGWWVVGPILVLLLIDTRWAAAFFLIVVAALAIWLLWKLLPYVIFFAIGMAMAVGLFLGLGRLFGVDV